MKVFLHTENHIFDKNMNLYSDQPLQSHQRFKRASQNPTIILSIEQNSKNYLPDLISNWIKINVQILILSLMVPIFIEHIISIT